MGVEVGVADGDEMEGVAGVEGVAEVDGVVDG